ncbi:complement C4-B [Eucyclogobius newberryi]|uniref:complement C4-B n=1 Tax=Eucyclogobius newberryi TaxID=166745 RepID=UPI003B5B023D
MMLLVLVTLLLSLAVDASPDDRFFMSAPNVFHEGVKEKVFVQMGKNHLHKTIRIYLEHESSSTILSEQVQVMCTKEEEGKTVELMIDQALLSTLRVRPEYVVLVAESSSIIREKTRVLLSRHRGYIFIQTNQPLYKPTDTVQFRIFTLDHTFRPSNEVCHLAFYNAVGNRAMKKLFSTKEGLFQDSFVIPDVAKTGIWRIMAHYEGDASQAVSKEFKVQRFVMPSFEVNIQMENKYILVNADEEIHNFTILARYSYGNSVNGAYHCQFGVITKGSKENPTFIRGMEQIGSVKNGIASVSVNTANLNQMVQKQMNLTLSGLEACGKLLYLGVLVTDTQNGEIQEQQISIPVVSHKYKIDLSRTRSHFIPGFPIDVAAVVRLPDGSPAEKVPVKMTLMKETWERETNQQGAVFHAFNAQSTDAVSLTVSVDDSSESKEIRAAVSPADTYLYMDVEHKEYSVGGQLRVVFMTKNAPLNGNIHFLVLSRGSIVQTGYVKGSTLHLQISDHMVPSLRLIGYFYTQNNDIISDSVWLAVKGNCEEKVKVTLKGPFVPQKLSKLDIDLSGQEATVALLAVDTAFNSLNGDNKLTPEQMYSSMEAYDLGCSYGGGSDPGSVLVDAGLAFCSSNQKAAWRQKLACHSIARQKRSVDLEQEMMALKSKYDGDTLQNCCARGFLLIPMQLTCEERTMRVLKMTPSDPKCAEAFRDCCTEGQRLREQKNKEEAKKGLGRSVTLNDIEEHFMNTEEGSIIRKLFSSSFAFTSFTVKGKGSYSIALPDSITTWEIQVVTLSKASGLCVAKPEKLRAFKEAFVSLRLPASVKKYEQMYISPVIYNYHSDVLHVAVHMAQSEGLCSPGSATSVSFVNITVKPVSSQVVTFSAVPMKSGSIPITIRLYDINGEREVDAIEKPLNVLTEGFEKTEELTTIIELKGTNDVSRTIFDGTLPNDAVPDSTSNIFITMEEDGFSSSRLRNLLSPEKVAKLIHLPSGCLEQTSRNLVPTTVAVRYLDMSEQWFSMPPEARDQAVNFIGKGVDRYIYLLRENKKPGAYGSWPSHRPSTWLTSHVLKVLSMLGKRQLYTFGPEGRQNINSLAQELTEGVRYLSSNQETDGSFGNANPVLHRNILTGVDSKAAMTAFAALALNHSLELLEEQHKNSTAAVISKARDYLWSNFNQLQHPLAVAITAYSLSLHEDYAQQINGTINWDQFEATDKTAVMVETSSYALLTAVALNKVQQAHKLAHWLTLQENFFSGFYSSQDTIVALEALSEYELMRPARSETKVEASFTVRGKNHVEKLELENNENVEKDLKRFVGSEITAEFKGHGKAKVKVLKVFHLMEPKDVCNNMSIDVRVQGKVKYTAAIQENYNYYDYDDTEQSDDARVPRSAIEWFDIRTRRRRNIDSGQVEDKYVTYEICVTRGPGYQLSGMAIVDLTLLSGFEAEEEDLKTLKALPEQYISHYELSHGKVLIYLNELVDEKLCFKFDAKQLYEVGLLQPAPAVFYDYYEPSQKCTVFYSAPRRSKVISKLCSGDVCQCAERPCHKLQNTFKHAERDGPIKMTDRQEFACFYPLVEYAYMVTVSESSEKNNFELYRTTVTNILKIHGDHFVKIGSHRTFAKRRQCKGRLEVGTEYLIMGKDGTTTDSSGQKQYLLDMNTWVEPRPLDSGKTAHTSAYNDFNNFVEDFKTNSCKQ